ncbi:MAG: GtrA family protein [Methanoregula sp.]|uniref:GtrA family protein n=1 Tax=Methanoregula sp. TaxID=2052170 RepID=UPI003D098466
MKSEQIREYLRKHSLLDQFPKFACVGILNTIVGYGAFFILSDYFYYLLALILSHIIGVTHSFLWNKFWVFKSKQFKILEFAKFNLVYLFVLLANMVTLYISVSIFTFNPKIAQLAILPLITLISYAGQKYFSFRQITEKNC